jgi:hypothetical protein
VKSFGEAGVTTKVQHIRYNHYNNRRMKYLEMISNLLMNCSISENSFISPRGVTVPVKIPDSLTAGRSVQLKGKGGLMNQVKEQLGVSSRNLSRKPTSQNVGRKMTSTNVASSMSPNRKLTTKGLSPSSLEFSPKGTDKKAMKSTMTATLQRHEYPEMYRGAIDSLQVPLRVPLDLSYSQGNRKLANVIFKSECVQKVKEASIKRDMDIEHTKA